MSGIDGRVAFAKYEGLGNDFLIIEDLGHDLNIAPHAVVQLCDRRLGIGADGLILVRASLVADFKMDIINSDGSHAEMCGNGIGCLAKYVYDRGLIEAMKVSVETPAGVKKIDLVSDGERVIGARVDMGKPVFEAGKIPVDAELGEKNELVVATDDVRVSGSCVSMGNPHFVTFVADVKSAPVKEVGRMIETSRTFPKRTNVEFAQVVSDTEMLLRVWERGAGETLACGTGACAAAVISHLTGRTGRRVAVSLPGGRLDVEWLESDSVIMTGPANEIFTGETIVRGM